MKRKSYVKITSRLFLLPVSIRYYARGKQTTHTFACSLVLDIAGGAPFCKPAPIELMLTSVDVRHFAGPDDASNWCGTKWEPGKILKPLNALLTSTSQTLMSKFTRTPVANLSSSIFRPNPGASGTLERPSRISYPSAMSTVLERGSCSAL